MDINANLLAPLDPETRLWTLYPRDRNDRRLDYPYLDPAPIVARLLREL